MYNNYNDPFQHIHEIEHTREMIEIATRIANEVIAEKISSIIDQKIDEAIERKISGLDSIKAAFNLTIKSLVAQETDSFVRHFQDAMSKMFKKNGITIKWN